MENKIYTTDIFSSKKSSPTSSSTRTFDSIFPSPQAIGTRSKSTSVNQAWSSGKQGTVANKDGSMYREERGQPCHLSSSLYYGGQDVYSHSPNTQNQGSVSSYPIFKKDVEEDDDSNGTGASRGNWWKGSLYY